MNSNSNSYSTLVCISEDLRKLSNDIECIKTICKQHFETYTNEDVIKLLQILDKRRTQNPL